MLVVRIIVERCWLKTLLVEDGNAGKAGLVRSSHPCLRYAYVLEHDRGGNRPDTVPIE